MNKYMNILFFTSLIFLFMIYLMYPYIDAKIKLYLLRNSSQSKVITLESSPLSTIT